MPVQQRSEQFVTPAASVVEDGDAYLLKVEMPGVNKEGLEISVENNELTIIGRRDLAGDRRNIDPPRIAHGKFPARLRARSQHRHVEDFSSDRSGDFDPYASESGAGETAQDHCQLTRREAQISKGRALEMCAAFCFLSGERTLPSRAMQSRLGTMVSSPSRTLCP